MTLRYRAIDGVRKMHSPTDVPDAKTFKSCEKALVEENILAPGAANGPIDYFASGSVKP
jgi:hypothetical protein